MFPSTYSKDFFLQKVFNNRLTFQIFLLFTKMLNWFTSAHLFEWFRIDLANNFGTNIGKNDNVIKRAANFKSIADTYNKVTKANTRQ